MNIERYFDRIGFTGTPESSLEVLKELHQLHPLAIPFENVSSLLGREVSLDPERVFAKLVEEGRGGYCFEQNLLFSKILRELGFEVSEHAARVLWRSPEKKEMPRTHMLLKVTVAGQDWIADVGFGGLTMTAPLRLETGVIQASPHEKFRISEDGDEFVISAGLQDQWKAMYVFDLTAQYPVDFELANYFISTNPRSPFTQDLMLARPFRKGRHALQNGNYTKYGLDGRKSGKTIGTAEELADLMEDIFRISLNEADDKAELLEKFTEIVSNREESA